MFLRTENRESVYYLTITEIVLMKEFYLYK